MYRSVYIESEIKKTLELESATLFSVCLPLILPIDTRSNNAYWKSGFPQWGM